MVANFGGYRLLKLFRTLNKLARQYIFVYMYRQVGYDGLATYVAYLTPPG
jgi:hypothetical protein